MPFEPVLDGLLRSAAILSAALIVLTTIGPEPVAPDGGRQALKRLGYGVALGIFSAVCMLWPITEAAGYRFDARAIPVVLAAPFFGLPAGGVTFAIALAARWSIGGAGVWTASVTLLLVFGLSAVIAIRRGWSVAWRSEAPEPIPVGMVALVAVIPAFAMAVPLPFIAKATAMTPPTILTAVMAIMIIVPLFTLAAGLVLRADERRRALERGLKESNETLSGIFANAPGVILRWVWGDDLRPRFQFAAGRIREVLGIDGADLLRDSDALFGRIHPDDALRMREAVNVPGYTGDYKAEFRYRHDDGTIRWLQGTSRHRNAREPRGVSDAIIMDVTPLRTAQELAASAKERADYFADHDGLTGLTTRLALVRRAMQDNPTSTGPWRLQGVALILIDLIGSKEINERFGHAVGDARIVAAAQRIAATLPPDRTARMAGDMFGLLVCGKEAGEEAAEEAEQLAVRVLASLSEALVIDGAVVPLAARAGYAVAEEPDATIETLVRLAEIALEAARDRSEAAPMRHSADIEQERRERRLFNDALAEAIGDGALTIAWQPIVAVPDQAVVGYEALARWRRPGHGAIAPDRFVATAERIGLWQALDRHMLRAACLAAAPLDGGWISVNVSSKWVHEGDLAAMVREALAESGLAPHRLWLEFTERVVMDHSERTWSLLDALRGLGVEVAIDDFGAVYSSLSYLHRLPVKKIKLDRSFITDLETNERAGAIVEAVLALCRRLEINVVAEGVETEAQRDWLAAHGCAFMQGYLIGRPVEAA